MQTDPACKMLIEPKQAAGKRVWEERIYYFCSAICLAHFDKEPERFVAVEAREEKSASE